MHLASIDVSSDAASTSIDADKCKPRFRRWCLATNQYIQTDEEMHTCVKLHHRISILLFV